MKKSELKSLIKSIVKEAMTTRFELDSGLTKAVNLQEEEETYMRGKFVNRGDVKLQRGLDYKTAEKIANNHWDIFGSMGADENGVFNFKIRGDRFCCAVGMFNGKPAMLNVTTTPGRLQLLVGDELNPSLEEMSATGGVAGYSTPFAFTKNKKGSPRGIKAAEKYGKVVKDISEETKK